VHPKKKCSSKKKFKTDHCASCSTFEKVNQLSFASSREGQARSVQKISTNCSGLNQCRVQEILPYNLANRLNWLSLIKRKYLSARNRVMQTLHMLTYLFQLMRVAM